MISISKIFENRIIQNPDTVLIQNKYYPTGLTEEDIYNYYHENKDRILDQVKRREVILFLAVNKNSFIVKRNIFLNKTNYDKHIHPRVVSIHSTMRQREKFGIIDVDIDNFEKAKQTTYKVYNKLRNTFPKISIRYTGKESFHLICPFVSNTYKYIDDIRIILKRLLENLNIENTTVKYKRTKNIPNLDLSPNKNRGGFITLHSLSVLGLKCMEVKPNQLLNFQMRTARIK